MSIKHEIKPFDIKIIIHDLKGGSRGENSLNAAKRVGFEEATSWTGTQLIAISHSSVYGDDTRIESVPFCENEDFLDKCILVYSTDGVDKAMMEKEDIESNRVAWISHDVPRSGYITKDIWRTVKQELSKNGNHIIWKEDEITLHHNHKLLASLLILSQGFLTLYTITESNRENKVDKALELMGYKNSVLTEILDKVDLFDQQDNIQIRKSLLQRLSSKKWWRKPFQECGLLQNLERLIVEDLHSVDNTNIIDSDPIRTFVEWMKSDIELDTHRLAKIVASLYTEVQNKFSCDKFVMNIDQALQSRHIPFSHDWRGNRFMKDLEIFLHQAPNRTEENNIPEKDTKSLFNKNLLYWNQYREQVSYFLQIAPDALSPRQYFHDSPLNNIDDETRTWLPDLVHALWIERSNIHKKIHTCRKRFRKADHQYRSISDKSIGTPEPELDKNTIQQLKQFHEQYMHFKNNLSDLQGVSLWDN